MDEAVNPLELSHEKHENWSRDMVLIAGSFQQKSGRHVTCSKAWKRKTRWHHVDVQWVQSKPCVPSALLSFLSTRPAVWSAAANCSVTALYARAAVPGRPQPLTGAQHLSCAVWRICWKVSWSSWEPSWSCHETDINAPTNKSYRTH